MQAIVWGGAAKIWYHTRIKPASETSLDSKIKTEILLHVSGGQGNRGVLDLSQFASQNFHFASEDLEIKSNTPQVSQIQQNYPEQHKKGAA